MRPGDLCVQVRMIAPGFTYFITKLFVYNMKTRFLFIFAVLFSVAAAAGLKASAIPDEGNREYAVHDVLSYTFNQPDPQCQGELEIPPAVSGSFANPLNKDSQRKDHKTNLRSGLQLVFVSAYNIPVQYGGVSQATYSPDCHTGCNTGSSLLHYFGRLNI